MRSRRRVKSGVLRVGDVVVIDGVGEARVDAIEVFRKSIDEATVGDNIGVLFRHVEKDQLGRGRY
jgi:elongation factor Tu